MYILPILCLWCPCWLLFAYKESHVQTFQVCWYMVILMLYKISFRLCNGGRIFKLYLCKIPVLINDQTLIVQRKKENISYAFLEVMLVELINFVNWIATHVL